jgi:hypothetical protein
VVQEAVLARVSNPDLSVHVIWTAVLPSDDFAAAEGAQDLLSDPRTRHYWDPDQSLGKAYTAVVELPEGNDGLAWDIYFLYEPGASWSDEPPTPDAWWHQLAFGEQYLGDGSILRGALGGA